MNNNRTILMRYIRKQETQIYRGTKTMPFSSVDSPIIIFNTTRSTSTRSTIFTIKLQISSISRQTCDSTLLSAYVKIRVNPKQVCMIHTLITLVKTPLFLSICIMNTFKICFPCMGTGSTPQILTIL